MELELTVDSQLAAIHFLAHKKQNKTKQTNFVSKLQCFFCFFLVRNWFRKIRAFIYFYPFFLQIHYHLSDQGSFTPVGSKVRYWSFSTLAFFAISKSAISVNLMCMY